MRLKGGAARGRVVVTHVEGFQTLRVVLLRVDLVLGVVVVVVLVLLVAAGRGLVVNGRRLLTQQQRTRRLLEPKGVVVAAPHHLVRGAAVTLRVTVTTWNTNSRQIYELPKVNMQ